MPTPNSLKWSPLENQWIEIQMNCWVLILGQLFGVGMAQDLNTPFFNIYFKEIEKPIATLLLQKMMI